MVPGRRRQAGGGGAGVVRLAGGDGADCQGGHDQGQVPHGHALAAFSGALVRECHRPERSLGEPGPGRSAQPAPGQVTYLAFECVFYNGMVRAPVSDEELLAQIDDICRWFAASGPPAIQRQTAALVELKYIADGRSDLLTRYAGQCLRREGRGGPSAGMRERLAQLCIDAGADPGLIDG